MFNEHLQCTMQYAEHFAYIISLNANSNIMR